MRGQIVRFVAGTVLTLMVSIVGATEPSHPDLPPADQQPVAAASQGVAQPATGAADDNADEQPVMVPQPRAIVMGVLAIVLSVLGRRVLHP